MRSKILLASLVVGALPLSAQIVISGFLANPAGTDSPYEYVQLVATQAIDFASNNYSVVLANNGTATSSGWAAGGAITYKFDITSGSVASGETFYVGGSNMLIAGASSTDISSAKWIKTINTGTTGGDGFGNSNSGGVFGNGGSNADGVAVFTGTTVTSLTIPLDALFFGTGVGTAKPASGGYQMPTNDIYTSTGVFGDTGNSTLFPDAGSNQFIRLLGTYNTVTSSWTSARSSSVLTLTTSSSLSDITSAITVAAIPEPSSYAAIFGIFALAGAALRRRNRK